VSEARSRTTSPPGPVQPVATVRDLSIPGPAGDLPIRLYVPAHGASGVLVWFFGGGWALGSIDVSDGVCRRLAHATPCAVVAVGYRLAPEHPFPAAVEDCYAATRWVAEHGRDLGVDPARLAVGGTSAGGNLAAAVTLAALERGGPALAFQVLIYPPMDHRADTPSLRQSAGGDFFDRRSIAWCWSHYLAREADGNDPLASPLRARNVRGVPAALVVTADADPLRDEGELYAVKLAAAGVPTELVRYGGMEHGFFGLTGVLDAAAEAQAQVAAALRTAFGH